MGLVLFYVLKTFESLGIPKNPHKEQKSHFQGPENLSRSLEISSKIFFVIFRSKKFLHASSFLTCRKSQSGATPRPLLLKKKREKPLSNRVKVHILFPSFSKLLYFETFMLTYNLNICIFVIVRIMFEFVSWIIFVSKSEQMKIENFLFNFNLVMSYSFLITGVVISPDILNSLY